MSVSVQVLPGTLQPDQGKFSIYVYTNTMHGKMSLFILKQGVLPQLSNFIKLNWEGNERSCWTSLMIVINCHQWAYPPYPDDVIYEWSLTERWAQIWSLRKNVCFWYTQFVFSDAGFQQMFTRKRGMAHVQWYVKCLLYIWRNVFRRE